LRVLGQPSATSATPSVDPLGWHFGKAEAKAYLDKMTIRLQKAGLQAENALLEGPTAERIVEFAVANHVKLIILSSHGQSGLSGWNISSIVQKIILRAYVPAMIVPAYQPCVSDLENLHYRRLLAPLDGSQRAECVLPLATTLARFHKSQLLLAHLVHRPEMPRRTPLTQEEIELTDRITELNYLEATYYLEQLESRLSPDVEVHLIVREGGTAALHDLVQQENVDLVILSAHGYSGGAKWPYGSIALSFIAYGITPLLIVQDISRDQAEKTQAEMAATEYKGH
jgi:nucleotide-binding universal stress UspA family protein